MKRFRLIRPYLAGWFFSPHPRPPAIEVLQFLFQPAKESRARRYLLETGSEGDYVTLRFRGEEGRVFYYPRQCRWIDLCQTIDECCNRRNWHHFLGGGVELEREDVVVDCGAAEGLFTFLAAPKVRRVYAVEPCPVFVAALHKNFDADPTVRILPCATGHATARVRMTDDEIFSHIGAEGSVEVEVRRLDDLLADETDRVSLIKADVEGYEFQVLLGAEEIIRRWRPKITLTVYHPQNNVFEIRDFLRRVHPTYRIQTRGLSESGNPILLRAW